MSTYFIVECDQATPNTNGQDRLGLDGVCTFSELKRMYNMSAACFHVEGTEKLLGEGKRTARNLCGESYEWTNSEVFNIKVIVHTSESGQKRESQTLDSTPRNFNLNMVCISIYHSIGFTCVADGFERFGKHLLCSSSPQPELGGGTFQPRFQPASSCALVHAISASSPFIRITYRGSFPKAFSGFIPGNVGSRIHLEPLTSHFIGLFGSSSK